MSELPTNVGTSDGRNFRRSSGLPTCTVEQTASTTDAGTPGLGQVIVGTPDKRWDFRRSGLPTIVGTSDGHRQQVREPSMPGLPAWVGTSDCREFRLTSGLPTSTVTAQAVIGSQHFRQES